MIIAVTGANGHVGVNLCDTLTKQGHEVRALTHDHNSFLEGIPLRQFRGDLLDLESLRTFVDGADVVFHLAAKISIRGDRDGNVWKVNTDGPRNMVETAKAAGVKKFVHFSSIHAFQQYPSGQVLDEHRALVGETGFAYDRSKATGERIVKEASRDGLDAVIINPCAIIGPHDPKPSLTGKAVISLINHQIPALVPGGYNWVDVRDVVNGAISASQRGVKGEKYLLSGNWCSLPDLSSMLARLSGAKTPRKVMPFWLARLGLPFITSYSRIAGSEPLYTGESLTILNEGSRMISSDKARRELDYKTRSLETTLSDLIDWFREKGMLNKKEDK
jgi:dihydroflavonol-4-reductase